MLITKCNTVGLKHRHNPKAFTESSNDMDDIYENIGDYNPNGKCKILLIAIESFMKRRKLNIYLIFIVQSYFVEPNK